MVSFLLLAAAFGAQAASPDLVVGRWRTETKNGIVEIQRCGPSICGRLLTSDKLSTDPNLKDVNNSDARLRARPLKNLMILSGFKQDGGGWSGGRIYNADDGKTYSAKVTPLGADRLAVRGCVFVPLCKTQTWVRVR